MTDALRKGMEVPCRSRCCGKTWAVSYAGKVFCKSFFGGLPRSYRTDFGFANRCRSSYQIRVNNAVFSGRRDRAGADEGIIAAADWLANRAGPAA
jgi:hypothetical protein